MAIVNFIDAIFDIIKYAVTAAIIATTVLMLIRLLMNLVDINPFT